MLLKNKVAHLVPKEAREEHPKTSSLVDQFGASTIKRGSVLATRHGAIDLSQGFPDDETPSHLKNAAIEAITLNRNQYAESWGTEALRYSIAEKTNSLHGTDINGADNVTVTCGATEAMMASLLSVVEPGDDVIIFEPAYENFRAQCLMARANPVFVPLDEQTLAVNSSALEAAFSDKTAAILICNPNNPSGKVFSKEELEQIAVLCKRYNAIAISDETYEHMVYDGRAHFSLAAVESFQDRWIVVSSCSKTFFMTGWRIGYAIAPKRFTKAIRRVSDYLSGVAATPMQDAAAVALNFDGGYYRWLHDFYAKKRSLLLNILRESGLKCDAPQGAYFILADMSEFMFEDSVMFCEYLMKTVGVAAVPWRAFYQDHELGRYKVRFNFAKNESTLRAAGERLKKLEHAHKRN